jgi:hypothetical protein
VRAGRAGLQFWELTQGWHAVGDTLSVLGLKVPAAHREQVAPPGLFRKLPGGHDWHASMDELPKLGLNFPVGQDRQLAAVPPAVGLYFPEAQLVQELEVAAKVPSGQEVAE